MDIKMLVFHGCDKIVVTLGVSVTFTFYGYVQM